MKSATVVGCGIVGLTSALALQEKGFAVRIVAKEKHEHSLSNKVGAIWFPFEVHPVVKATQWATRAYGRYQQELFPGNGVSFIPFTVVYSSYSDTAWRERLPKTVVRQAKEEELPRGASRALIAMVPLAEPPKYLPSLFERFISNGGIFEQIELQSLNELAALGHMVVNCTGLGAKELCSDSELRAMRGQILRTKKIDAPSCVNSTQAGALTYVIQRSGDCIIGGTDYLDDWNLEVDPKDTELILKRLLDTGLTAYPPEIIETLVGLRPRRSQVRFEFDSVFGNVFHNYGHGGAGFTVAWGCALELAELLQLR